jgi:hypothetical protein
MKSLTAFVLLLAGLGIGAAGGANAAENSPASGTAPAKKTTAKKADKTVKKEAPEEKAPDVAGMQSTAYDCELGNKVTIYHAPEDDQKIAIHWKKRTHEMTRVGTSTGANRFENTKEGLVWIGIPAKSMLLDSKKGQQLANECKHAEQLAPKVTESKAESAIK